MIKKYDKKTLLISAGTAALAAVVVVVILGFLKVPPFDGFIRYSDESSSSADSSDAEQSAQAKINNSQNDAFAALDSGDTKVFLSKYDDIINSQGDDKPEMAYYYITRANKLLVDNFETHKDQILRDGLKADELSPSAASATFLVDVYVLLGDQPNIAKYVQLSDKRGEKDVPTE